MTKRKLSGAPEQIPLPPSRKKQAVTTTRSSVTKAIIQRNASTSPLLKLPAEIRTIILSLVVGHQFIHLLYFPFSDEFRHTLCTATVSEDEAYKDFMTGHTHIPSNDSADYHSVTFRQRHKHCKSWDREKERFFDEKQRTVFRRMTAEQRRKPMLDLRILGACRQMYEEANMLLWTTNTFSFEDSTCLKIFIDGLHSTQRNKLTRMHIDFAWKIDSALGWIRLLRPSFVSKFISLQTLYATFDHYAGETANSFQQFIVAPLTWMKMLSLRHVTVVFGDDGTSIYTSIYQRHRWAIAKKREIARGLRNKLLDPNGHEVLAAEIQAKEAEWQFPTRRRSIGDEWAVEAASRS